MASPLDKLIGLSLVSIDGAMGSPRWEREMERVIRTAHTAAWLTATAERLGVRDPGLLKRPTRAERADIDAAVKRQLEYLRGFVAARGGMSDAAARARARLYGPAVKSFYYGQRWGDWEIPDQLLPGNQRCLGNCLCRGHVKDNGDGTGLWVREMGGTEHHCDECPPLAGEHPIKRRGYAVKVWRWAWSGWAVKHGSHDQSSHGRRRGRGGRGGGRRVSGGAEPADRLRNIEAELASPYLSAGRRQMLEKQRGGLMSEQSSPVPATTDQRLQSIDAELASPYTSLVRRQLLERQRASLTQEKPQTASQSAAVQVARRSLRAEVDETETQIRGLRVERAVFFGPNGERLVDVTGDAKSYRLSQKEFDSLRGVGATMTHNHPGGWERVNTDPRHQGSSFSLADIRQAAALNLSEVRAVTPTRRFWMKPPPGGWEDHHWQTTIPKAYARADKEILASLVQQVRMGRLTMEEATARHYHEVWTRVAREVGASYGVEDR
jgi:hypothetical protein